MPKPEHMDIGSRNQRLYSTLTGIGLYVEPIFSETDSEKIDYMHVSAELPEGVTKDVAQKTAFGPVAAPVSGTEDTAPEGKRGTVINFPAKLG